jgi:hypothetical protein
MAVGMFLLTGILCIVHLFSRSAALNAITEFLCVTLPAGAAACHAIGVQGELRRVAARSETMTKLLRRRAFFRRRRAPAGPTGLSWRQLADDAQEASRVMLEETLDWRVLLLNHPPHTP